MGRATSTGVLLATALLVLIARPAGAESRTPVTRLVAGGHEQRGAREVSWCWGSEGFCYGQTGPVWGGSVVRAPAGASARIRILYPERPNRIQLQGWREIDCGIDSCWGTRGRRVYHLGLRRIRRDGDVTGWSALFNLIDRPGDLYLLLRGRWDPDHYATWTFHLDLR